MRPERTTNLKDSKLLFIFLCVHFFVWVLVPLFRFNIPMDSAEALVWGSEWQLGTNKHPFLSGWLIEIFYQAIRHPDLAAYVLSQVCVLLGMFYVYRLARFFVEPGKALLSALFLEGTIYYSICSVEYNVNVLSLAIVPMLVYYFHQGITTHRQSSWLLTGLLAGLALMTKYTNGLFLFCLGLYLIATKEGRREFKQSGIYLAAMMGCLICLPHILWLWSNDFYVLDYFLHRSAPKKDFGFLNHLIFPLKFLTAQVLAVLGSLVLLAVVYFKTPRTKRYKLQKPSAFLVYTGLLPLLILVVFSGLCGIPLKSMWGFAFVAFIPLILFVSFPFTLLDKVKKGGVCLSYLVLMGMALSCLIGLICTPSLRSHFDGRSFAREMKAFWMTEQKEPLKYVGGEIWFGSNVSLYLPERPRVLIQMNPQQVPWIDEKDVLAHGCLVMTGEESDYQAYQARYPMLGYPKVMENEVQSFTGKKRKKRIFYGILPPQQKGL